MKLLIVVSSMNPLMGGITQGIRNNLPFWLKNELEVTIVTLDEPDAAFVKQDNIVALGPGSSTWGYSKLLKGWLLQHLCNYDLVVVHGLWLYNNYALYQVFERFKRSSKVLPKLFVMPHGMLDPFFQKSKERYWKAKRNVLYWHLIEKKLIKLADGILFTCETEMLLAETTFRDYKPKRIFNIGFGINEPPQYSTNQKKAFELRCPALNNRPYILFLGRIDPKKGVDLLIKAYIMIKEKFWSESKNLPVLLIAGPDNNKSYGQNLLIEVKNNPLVCDDILFVSMLEGDSKWGAFYGCEAFILPSHQENFGIAVVEAMACKKPLLISNKVNIWREIEAGKAGIIENDDVMGAVGCLSKWCSLNQHEKNEMGLNAYNTYQKHFTAESTTNNFLSVVKNSVPELSINRK